MSNRWHYISYLPFAKPMEVVSLAAKIRERENIYDKIPRNIVFESRQHSEYQKWSELDRWYTRTLWLFIQWYCSLYFHGTVTIFQNLAEKSGESRKCFFFFSPSTFVQIGIDHALRTSPFTGNRKCSPRICTRMARLMYAIIVAPYSLATKRNLNSSVATLDGDVSNSC